MRASFTEQVYRTPTATYYDRWMRLVLALLMLSLVGCGTPRFVVIDGHRVERPTVGYSDGLRFAIEHRRAFPDVLSDKHPTVVDDGRIVGRICGLDIDFDASWHGQRVELTGRTDVAWFREFTETEGLLKLSLDVVEPEPGHRHIVGRLLSQMTWVVDIDASADRLVAQINRRHYDLAPDGHFLVGRMHDLWSPHPGEPPREVDIPFNIYGREALATMLPADEALVLFFMLLCNGVTLDHNGKVENGFSLVRLSPTVDDDRWVADAMKRFIVAFMLVLPPTY